MWQLRTDFITLFLNLAHSLLESSAASLIIKARICTNCAMVCFEWLAKRQKPVVDNIGDAVIEAESIGFEVVPPLSL